MFSYGCIHVVDGGIFDSVVISIVFVLWWIFLVYRYYDLTIHLSLKKWIQAMMFPYIAK